MNACWRLWRKAGLVVLMLAATMMDAWAEPPAPSAFRTADGSYVVTVGGDVTDPYFVNKALIIALESGMDVRVPVVAWLKWLLPRQRGDGGFDRFCGARDGRWRACMAADADDAMAATVIHLIALAARQGLLPPPLARQALTASRKARTLLDRLLDSSNGLYRVFADRPVFYLMDNAEVHAALVAARDTAQADKLVQAMRKGFFVGGRWHPAIPAYDKASFYPHVLSHSYLWQGAIADRASAASDMAGWLSQHSDAWLSRQGDRFAWGLVAWNISALAPAEAGCWRQSIRPWSGRVGWTVLDAFVDQALESKGIKPVCTRQP